MILFISFIVVAASLLLFLLWNKNKPGVFAKNRIEADAIILNIHLTGLCVKEEIQAIIQVQVHPERGKSFVGETRQMLTIAEYMQVQPGTRAKVKYAAPNRKEIVLLKDSFYKESKLGAAIGNRQSAMVNK